MRDDMFKVIVERPRRVNSNAYKGDGRPFRNREELAGVLGMKMGYNDSKGLNENLAPLKRFLEKQVNRPWDKVYAEIRAVIDARSTVKQHILQHLNDFVETQTRWEGDRKAGRVLLRQHRRSGSYVELAQSRAELFVHPVSGILLRNRFHASYKADRDREHLAFELDKSRVRRILSDRVQLHLINQVWYEVTLDTLPPPYIVLKEIDGVVGRRRMFDKRWDVLRKEWVILENNARVAATGSSQDYYGCAALYAREKRQLNSREIRDLQLNTPQQKQKARKGLLFFRSIFQRRFISTSFNQTFFSQRQRQHPRHMQCLHPGAVVDLVAAAGAVRDHDAGVAGLADRR